MRAIDSCRVPRVCLAAAFLTTIGVRYETHAVAQDPHPVVGIVVHNNADFPAFLLDTSELLVTRIYDRAGVTLEWRSARPTPERDRLPPRTVRILIAPPSATFSRLPSADVLGFTPAASGHHGGIAYVLAARVEAVARGYQVPRGAVLAAAMAHELGHLLLPDSSHTPTGLMRAQYNQADFRHLMRGELLFAPREAGSLRAGLIVEGQRVAFK